MFEFLRFFVTFIAGACTAFSATIWYFGININPWKANESAQTAVNVAVESSAKINASERASVAAVERVRLVYRTVKADTSCPPGAGVVSDGMVDRLRIAMAQTGSNNDSVGVRTGRADGVRASKD